MATTLLEPVPGLRGVTGEPWTGVRYFSTWRVGGVSRAPRDSLNLGTHVGDDPAAVRENRARLRRALPGEPLWLEQVHGTAVFDADTSADAGVASEAGPGLRAGAKPIAPARPADPAGAVPVPTLVPCADAAVTAQRSRPLVIMTADCLPVVLADAAGTVLGVAHAGWRGLAAGVLENTLDALRRRAPQARGWRAWIGPGIGPQAFQVGPEVREAFLDQDAGLSDCFVLQPDHFAAGPPQGKMRPLGGQQAGEACAAWGYVSTAGPPQGKMRPLGGQQAGEACAAWGHDKRWLADLAGLARARLLRAGVDRVEASGECTWTQADRYFSHRRDPGSGRQATLAYLV